MTGGEGRPASTGTCAVEYMLCVVSLVAHYIPVQSTSRLSYVRSCAFAGHVNVLVMCFCLATTHIQQVSASCSLLVSNQVTVKSPSVAG